MNSICLNYPCFEKAFYEFAETYESRPIRDNSGGMGLNHSFALWYLLKQGKPDVVIESGVWKGHSTWLIEQAVPSATIFSFDLDLSRVEYKSKYARYTETDLMNFDWSEFDLTEAFLFLDDHQNAYRRIKEAYFLGIKNLIIEDNYPISEGDCYSFKRLKAGAGAPKLQMSQGEILSLEIAKQNRIHEEILMKYRFQQDRIVIENSVDYKNLSKLIEIEFEFPPVYLNKKSVWGTPYKNEYQTSHPIFSEAPIEDVDYSYVYLQYLKLR